MKTCRKAGHEYDSSLDRCPICRAAYFAAREVEYKEQKKAYYQENRERKLSSCKQYYEENKEKILERNKAYQTKNRQKKTESNRRWRSENKDRMKAHLKKRKANDPVFRLSRNVRSLIKMSFKLGGWEKSSKTQEILGCDFETLYQHLVSTAIANYGFLDDLDKYQIDHITPLATASSEEEVVKLNHYYNLQFLYAKHNRAKSDKLDWSLESTQANLGMKGV